MPRTALAGGDGFLVRFDPTTGATELMEADTALKAWWDALKPELERQEAVPPPSNATSLLGALLKVLTTGDLALTLCSPEPPVLTELRDWLTIMLNRVYEVTNGVPQNLHPMAEPFNL